MLADGMKKDEMPCSVTDGPHEADDLKEVMKEITRGLHKKTLEMLWDKETKSWRKQ